MRHAPARLTLGLGAPLLALALAACAGVAGSEQRTAAAPEPSPAKRATSQRASSSDTPVPAPETSAPPSPAPPPTPPTAAPPTPTTRPGPTERLLVAAELPGFGDGLRWEATSTRRSEGEEPFGTCHRFAMTSIGAMRVVVRGFEPVGGSDPATASHLVADFPDERTAQRALEVLKSWRGECADELEGYDRHDVGALQQVDAPHADAGWYLLTYGPVPGGSDERYADAQGLTRVGRWIAVLQVRTVGQDHLPDQEQMSGAVRAASGRLG